MPLFRFWGVIAASEIAEGRKVMSRVVVAEWVGGEHALVERKPLATYEVRGDGGVRETFEAPDDAAARVWVEAWLREGSWHNGDEEPETVWPHAWLFTPDGEQERITVAIDPPIPQCTDGRGHDWQSPHDIVGGCKENPGVWGSGGGVKIHEVCMRCGCGRVTDTWAQDRSTGRQGLTSVRYQPRKRDTR